MSLIQLKQRPLKIKGGKTELRTQFAALCWRQKDKSIETLLVTSRTTKRWILPRGWPVDGATPAEAAAAEAWEEAGVTGRVNATCLGVYSYSKRNGPHAGLPCMVAVFPLKVKVKADDWPEAGQRKRKWFTLKQASALVAEPELKQIIRHFDPSLLP